ncbi:MAG: phage tail protein [Dehalococcoidia bacterium]
MSADPISPAAARLRSQVFATPPRGGPPALRPTGGPLVPRPSDRPPGLPEHVSTYLELLPGIYRDNPFLGRFLLIFEHMLSPVERTVDNIPWYFDAGIAPRSFLPWLAGWVGLMVDERWPEDRRRAVIAGAAELYRWRGTKRGLREFLRLYLDVAPEILEPTARQVAADRTQAFQFTVRITLPAGRQVDPALVEEIVAFEKPAWAAFTVEIRSGA